MWGKRKATPLVIPEQVSRRASTMATPDIFLWSEQATYAAGRHLSAYHRTGSPEDLSEVQTAVQVLAALTEELLRRQAP